MTEYQLQILRNQDVLPSYDTAVGVLNAYQYHRVGQPLAVRYYQGSEIRVLFAIGKKDCEDVEPGQPSTGPSFYDIINKDMSAATAVMRWRMLGGSVDQDVTHALFLGAHTSLVAQDAEDLGLGTLIYCNDGVIARVKKLKESDSESLNDWYEFYGNAGGGSANLLWVPIGSDTEQHVAFETGTQTEYDAAEKVDEHLYVTTTQNRVDRLYKGEQLLGDAYVSGEDSSAKVANAIGGIQSGTTLESIMNATQGSISKVIDMMLFPAYAPQYSGPSGKFTTPDASATVYIYSTLPAATTTTSKAYTYAGSKTALGGECSQTTITRTYPNGSTDDGSTSIRATAIGSYTYSASFKFAAGTDKVVDTKGNPAKGCASNASTPASSSSLDASNLESKTENGSTYYVVKARTNISASSITIKTVYPIWIGQPGGAATIQTEARSSAIQSGGLEGVQLNASKGSSAITTDETNSWYIDIPAGKTLKVILKDLADKYPDANAQQIKLLPSTTTRYGSWVSNAGVSEQIAVDRYVYNGASYSGGKHKIIVS